jgi:hypothetical protein
MTLEERRERRQERKAAKAAQAALPPSERPEVHVPRIMDPDPLIFPPKLRLALQFYLDTEPRDAKKASSRAHMDVEEFKKHLHSPGVREWLRKQEDLIDEKVAELRARARVLTQDHLDAAIVDLLESKTTPAAVKATVITTGCRRFGMLKDKVENTGANGAPMAFQLVRIGIKKNGDADADGSAS